MITRNDVVGEITVRAYQGRSIWNDIRKVAAGQRRGPLPVKVAEVAGAVLRLDYLRDEGRARERYARARWTF
jgi:hypothetical protein